MGSQWKLIATILLGGLTAWSQTDAGQIGYKSAADAEQKKTLLLRDFHPASMLHVPAHEVPKAKFYVIDVHNHINDAARHRGTHAARTGRRNHGSAPT